MSFPFRRSLLTTLVAATMCLPAHGQAPATPTIWNFLGIPQGIRKIQGNLINRRGNFPGLEPKPPLRSIADPANLEEGMPDAVKKAAEIKQAEDLKKQKIKAIKYLAKIGCGCYDLDGGVTDALVASMGDCTEAVRVQAVKAVKTAAKGDKCCHCGEQCCCNEDIIKKLAEMAYEKDDKGCWLEPSARVREHAAEALCICCPDTSPPPMLEFGAGEEEEGGEGEKADDDEFLPPAQEEEEDPEAGGLQPAEEDDDADDFARYQTRPYRPVIRFVQPPALPEHVQRNVTPVQNRQQAAPRRPVVRTVNPPANLQQLEADRSAAIRTLRTQATPNVRPQQRAVQPTQKSASVGQPRVRLSDRTHQSRGAVVKANAGSETVHVHFASRETAVPVGTRLNVYRPHGRRLRIVGQVQVVRSVPGAANVRPVGNTATGHVHAGDNVGIPLTRVVSQSVR